MKSFRGRIAAITGASSGIGRALALALARRGAHLALADLDETNLAATADAAAAAGPGARITRRRVDVARRDEVLAWADEVARDHGGCHVIVNNAGVGLGATAEGVSPDDFAWLMSINFWGVVHGTQAFLPLLRASGEGHVVNLSSLFGIVAAPGQSAYNASKFAVRGYTEALRLELELEGAPVSATSVHPGGIRTGIARASRVHDSLRSLGVADPRAAADGFERQFRTSPEDAAEAILRGVRRNRRRVLIGADARAIDLLQRVLPAGYQPLVVSAWRRLMR